MMEEKRTEKNSYTVIFAIFMVFVVGALLAFASKSLEPTISENKRLEKRIEVLQILFLQKRHRNYFLNTSQSKL